MKTSRRLMPLSRSRIAWTVFCLCALLSLGACNVGFDVEEFGPLEAEEDLSGTPDASGEDEDAEVPDDPPDADVDDSDADAPDMDMPGEPDKDVPDTAPDMDMPDDSDVEDMDVPDEPDTDTDEPDTDEPVCEDSDGDQFFAGEGCVDQPLDCDDTRNTVYPGAAEVCDGLDNDCDEDVDEDENGETLSQMCYTGNPGELEVDATSCRSGVVFCEGGAFPDPVLSGQCIGQVLPLETGEETGSARCDGFDNDCNGEVDPHCECPELGQTESCYAAGDPEHRGLGICSEGTRECTQNSQGNGVWGPCEGDVAPGTETCQNTGTDDNCDGLIDNIENLGSACDTQENGPCADGEWTCNEGGLVCMRTFEPSEEETCDGIDNNCDGNVDEGVANACGTCGELPDGFGEPCGICGGGTFGCDEDHELVCVGAREVNSCNGCEILPAEPGASCGVCNDGRYVCDGENAVACEGASTRNLCGGCGELPFALDSPCGDCGMWTCDPDQVGMLTCNDPGLNACDGCGELPFAPETACGACGAYTCNDAGDGVSCEDPGRNSCGGCEVLPGVAGEPCGDCGVWTCDGNDGLVCQDRPANLCGGCGELQAAPGTSCGACSTWECNDDNSAVTCVSTTANSCGGCGPLVGPPVGTSCGTCGAYACSDDGLTTACEDPGLNACLVCGELDNQPGDACPDCGYYVCNEDTGETMCFTDRCPEAPGAARFVHAMVGGPTIDVRYDGFLNAANFTANFRTIYLEGAPGAHFFELFQAGSNQTSLILRKNYTVADGQQQTIVFGGVADGSYGQDNIFTFVDDNEPIPGMVKIRYVNLVVGIPRASGATNGIADAELLDSGMQPVQAFNGVSFGQASQYYAVPPGAYTFRAYTGDANRTTFGQFNNAINFYGGEVITMIHYGVGTGTQALMHHPSTLTERTYR